MGPSRPTPPAVESVWKTALTRWVLFALAVGTAAWITQEGLLATISAWDREEYSHGYMLPLVAAFFVWQKSGVLAQTQFRSSWAGVAIALFGLFVYLVGELGTTYALIQYAFLIILGGAALAFMGWPAFKIVLPAYMLLFFTIPLPAFLYNNLSANLQLISSDLGVRLIRLFGISVFLEGNVIDLGNYKLQVVEACSGLRYLFPLAALGYISAYIFKGALWKKVVLFLSTLPITVLMNSFRIGVIGVLVEYSGIEHAEGFLHDFEGWVVFMACAALLVLLMWALAKIGPNPMPLRDAFAIEGPGRLPENAVVQDRRVPASFYAVLPALAFAAAISQVLPHREEITPDRADFLFFPSALGDWRGRTDRLDDIYVDALKLDDYLLSDYTARPGEVVNLYIAYYDSQRKGASVHSPKSCLPGGGWEIQDFSQRDLPGVSVSGRQLRVNRSLIQMGDERLLVYYWFQQRGRVMTNEYWVKLYLFWDALTRARTDGALVRITTRLDAGQDVAETDAVLSGFARSIAGQLPRFIPD